MSPISVAVGQRGTATLLAVLVMLVAAATLLARQFGFQTDDSTMRTQRALAMAREALIAYAAMEDNSPGALPCPDQDNDGFAQNGSTHPCTAPYIGRLPWRTLGLGMLVDGSGECLWYAITPSFRNTIQTTQRGEGRSQIALNPHTGGEIVLYSSPGSVTTHEIAVVFAPGAALDEQEREITHQESCHGGSVHAFLEGQPLDGQPAHPASDLVAFDRPADARFNDQIATISSTALFGRTAQRVLAEISAANGSEPRQAAKVGVTGNVALWWSRNDWCPTLCRDATRLSITLADGSSVARSMASAPTCVVTCSVPP